MLNGDYILIIPPDNYPGKLYRNRYCYEHYYKYWEATGVIPNDNQVIHHKDGNKHNNNIENLELMDRVEHISLHNKRRETKFLLCKCPICGKAFIREKRLSHIYKKNQIASYCSKHCSYKANTLRKKHDELFLRRLEENVICEFIAIK